MTGKFGKRITLLPQNEMLQRLLKVNNSDDLQENLYLKLIEAAGSKEAVAVEVAAFLYVAMTDYAEGKQFSVSAAMLHAQIPGFIDAICPDEEVAKEAKAFFERTAGTK